MIKIIVMAFLIFSAIKADTLKLSTALTSMDYEETSINGRFLDSEKSDYQDIKGIHIEYVKIVHNGFVNFSSQSKVELMAEYSKGDSNYDGYLQSKTTGVLTPYKSTTKNSIINIKISWVETNRANMYDASLFLSLGYRKWVRDLGGKYGYIERYRWPYADIGIRALSNNSRLHIGFEVAYQKAFEPKLYATLDNGLDFNLGSTYGYRYKFPLIYDINRKLSVELSYELDHWHISRSSVVNGYYEPQSKTDNKKILLGFSLKW